MRVALVTDNEDMIKKCLFYEKLKQNAEIRFFQPLIKEDYGVSVEEMIKREKSTVPLYRCEVVLYKAIYDWELLYYTMDRALGYGLVANLEEAEILNNRVAKCVLEKKLDTATLETNIHWYNRSIKEIKDSYSRFGFDYKELASHFEIFTGEPMSVNAIVNMEG